MSIFQVLKKTFVELRRARGLAARWIVFVSVLSFLSAARARADQVENQTIVFEYTFQDRSILHPDKLSDVTDWKTLEPSKMSLKPREGLALWLRMEIPRTDRYRDPVIKFFRLQEKFSFFVNGEKAFSFGEGLKYAGLPVHLLAVPSSAEPVEAYLRVESSLPLIGPRGSVYLGSRTDFITQLIMGDLTDFFVISVLALIGLAGFVLFVLYPKVRTYAFLGGFAIASGVYFLARMPSKIVFGLDPVSSGIVGLLGLYATPIFFLGFFREIFSITASRLLTALGLINGTFLIYALLTSFISPSGPLDLLFPFYGIAIISYLSPLALVLMRLRSHPYTKTFVAGFCLLFFAGLWEIAREVRIFRANVPMITWGFLGFVLSLVSMQGQFFASLFQQSKTNEQMANEARQRLERVLACTRDLSRTRNYKELIRVVAEALLAELNISGQDVSVDFFMPNGSAGHNDDSIHQFSYVYSQETGTASLYEISPRTGVGSAQASLGHGSDKLTSLPGISRATPSNHFSSGHDPSSVLTIPLLADGFVGAVAVRKYSEGRFELSDFSLLSKYVNSISASLQIALQNLEYVDEVKAKVAMDTQLDAAESLQAALLPEPLELPGIQYSAYCRSAGKTGGDWHGYYFCQRTHRLFLTIGDVTGHDFAASIMTGVAAGAVKAWQEHDSHHFIDSGEALVDLARLVNSVFCASNRGLKFMSMFFACIDLNDGFIHVVNAGHPHPFLLSPSQAPTTLHCSGHLLGQSADAEFHAEAYQLQAGDSVFFYTDGLFENQGEDGKCWSRRLFLRNVAGATVAHELLNNVLDGAQKVWGDVPPDDDVTLVAVTWQPIQDQSRKAS